MRINQDFIMVVMAGAGLLLVLALCMVALYKWISLKWSTVYSSV